MLAETLRRAEHTTKRKKNTSHWNTTNLINISLSLTPHLLRPAHIYNSKQQSPNLRSCSATWRWASNARNTSRLWTLIKCKRKCSVYQVGCVCYVITSLWCTVNKTLNTKPFSDLNCRWLGHHQSLYRSNSSDPSYFTLFQFFYCCCRVCEPFIRNCLLPCGNAFYTPV
jgi:hypothetical protein